MAGAGDGWGLAHGSRCVAGTVSGGPGPQGAAQHVPGLHGTVRNFVFEAAVEHQAAMAFVKRSPKMTANCALAMTHS